MSVIQNDLANGKSKFSPYEDDIILQLLFVANRCAGQKLEAVEQGLEPGKTSELPRRLQ